MAYTLDELTTLEKLYASGQLSVRYGDKQITYQSSADLLRAIQRMRSDLEARGLLAPTNRGRTTLAIYSRE